MVIAKQSREKLKQYYGRMLKEPKSKAFTCSDNGLPPRIREILEQIDTEVVTNFHGWGSPFPAALEGKTILDLGCGLGRDTYILSRLVGPDGHVIGVDMTDEHIDVAQRHLESQTKRFGYQRHNVDFKKGYIEDLGEIGIADEAIDIVISNSVINLSPDKRSVFSEIFRVLKPGGELYFSDVFAGRRIPDELKDDPILLGECLAGAMYIEDFRRLLREIGCPDYRMISRQAISLDNPEIKNKIGMVNFYSMTIRAFKLPDLLEDICEDYGQSAVYLGTIPDYPRDFPLDDHHLFKAALPLRVCGNSAAMVQDTRFSPHFKILGNRSVHYGPFDCSGSGSGDGACCAGGACG